jgi:hypothetical protein
MRDASLPLLFETYVFEERVDRDAAIPLQQSYCSKLI